MNKTILSLLMGMTCLSATAQNVSDSTDVFYKHMNLNEVVVTGVTGQTKAKESAIPRATLSSQQLQTTAATNLIDAVAHVPGVSQITTGGGISKPVIRGLGYNRIVVVDDGVRQEGQQWGDEHGIEIDEQRVSHVEVIKGPASLMYGSDALAGVLLLQSDPTAPMNTIRGNVSTEYQTNNGLFAYSLMLKGNNHGWLWNARWSQKLAHAYKNKEDGYVPNSQFRERALSGMIGRNFQWGHSYLHLSAYQLTPGIVEGERDLATGELLSPVADVKTYGHGMPYQQVHHYKATWDNSVALGQGIVKALVAYQQNQRQEFEEAGHPDEYGLYFKLHTLSYNLSYAMPLTNEWKLNMGVGGMYQRSLNKGSEYLIPAYNLLDGGIFISASRSMKRLSLEGGLRADHRHLHSEQLMDDGEERFSRFSRNFTGVSGSLGGVWHVADNLDMRLNLASGFRAPGISELASNGVHEGSVRYELGNNSLNPEHSYQADWGLSYRGRVFEAQLSIFASRIDNYIFARRTEQVMEDGYHTYQFTSGDARLLGGELFVDCHPVHRLHLGTTFSYVDARQLHQPRETRWLPFTPATRLTGDVKYELTHNGRTFNNAYVGLNIEGYFRQSHYYMADDTETATPGYALLNLKAGMDICSHGRRLCTLTVVANNLMDKVYQSHLNRLKYTDVNPVTGRIGVYNMGRNIVCKVSVPISIM